MKEEKHGEENGNRQWMNGVEKKQIREKRERHEDEYRRSTLQEPDTCGGDAEEFRTWGFGEGRFADLIVRSFRPPLHLTHTQS